MLQDPVAGGLLMEFLLIGLLFVSGIAAIFFGCSAMAGRRNIQETRAHI
jgi:hypothetical protein